MTSQKQIKNDHRNNNEKEQPWYQIYELSNKNLSFFPFLKKNVFRNYLRSSSLSK